MFAKIVIAAFMVLEFSNVVALYFSPGTKRANAVGVFSAWEQSKLYPEIHEFIKYLVYWVAGAKLIFLVLLGVILFYGDQNLHRISLIALCVAIMSFFWRLFPTIRELDKNGKIKPKNYSITLSVMIVAIALLFTLASII